MADPKEDYFQIVAKYLMIGVVGAAIRALLVKEEKLLDKMKNFAAGVLGSLLVGYVLRNTTLSDVWKETVCGCIAAFISTMWPVMEKLFIKWFTKKGNDILPGDGA